MNTYFGIEEYAIVDNFLSQKYPGIKGLDELSAADIEDAKVLICSDRPDIWDELRAALYKCVPKSQCIEIFPHPGTGLGLRGDVNNFSISAHLLHEVGHQAAKLISNTMPQAKPFTNRRAMWEYILMNEIEIDGRFLEFGVFEGSSINYIAALKPGHTIYGFDSFEGLPADWGLDVHCNFIPKGHLDKKGILPQVNSNVRLVKGWFENTLPSFLDEHSENCAFTHIDCDIYSSTKTVLFTLRDRIVPGTVIQFDEFFNYPGWQKHEYKAFQEFLIQTGMKCKYLGYNDASVQVAVKII